MVCITKFTAVAGGVGSGYFVCPTRRCRFESCLECKLKWSIGKGA